ncbi:MAG: Hpt domain-containing protein [Kiritimatiellae bacterium]|nr:Hpt domain-containing protein [Kiritimatiellia bacterium]
MKECCRIHLTEQFGDAATVEAIYTMYVESIGEKLAEAKGALAGADWGKLDAAAHTIKGNALSAGDTPMADVAIALRNASKLQDAGDAAKLIERIEALSAGL